MKNKLLFFFMSSYFLAFGQKNEPILFQNEEVKIYKTKAIYKDEVLYEVEDPTREELTEEAYNEAVAVYYTPLSLIGNYFNYEKASFELGYPSSYGEIISLDLRTKEPLSILDVVEERSLVDALIQDGWVRGLEGMDLVELECSQTIEVVLRLINQHTAFAKFSVHSFAVLDYNERKEKVAIRFIGPKKEGNLASYVQLGLWVSPLERVKKRLKQSGNFFMGKFKFQEGIIMHQ